MAVWDAAQRKPRSPYSHPWLAEALSAFDMRQRRRQAVFEYSHNPACIFRLDIGRARRLLALGDGTRVGAGGRVARLHFWDEQIPQMPEDGATIGLARRKQPAHALAPPARAPHLAAQPPLAAAAPPYADVAPPP